MRATRYAPRRAIATTLCSAQCTASGMKMQHHSAQVKRDHTISRKTPPCLFAAARLLIVCSAPSPQNRAISLCASDAARENARCLPRP